MRKLVRKPDRPDPRDYRYVSGGYALVMNTPPQSMDLRSTLPPAWDQGEEGSCGPHSASALLCHLRGSQQPYSRQQIYYCTRQLENDVGGDDGVETRDLLKVLQKTGAAPEAVWPYISAYLYAPPTPDVLQAALSNVIGSYMRLVAEDDFISCLAEGFPFILGFTCFDSIESETLAHTGVMPLPDPSKEKQVGGHDVLVVGYDLKFRQSTVFKNSGVDPTLVSDHALLIRNSWGTEWGIQGHFWMPMPYAVNPSTGGDAWTGRL